MDEFLSAVLMCVIVCLLFAFPFMWAWNYAVVEAVSVAKPVGFWEALCLMVFVSMCRSSSGGE